MNLPKKIFLVIHDWGSGLGFHWANQHRDRVAGITFMESIVGPMSYEESFPEGRAEVFQVFPTVLLPIPKPSPHQSLQQTQWCSKILFCGYS